MYSGRVQGVGFRDTVARLAARYAVDGFVRNLPDGRVRLVAEGAPEVLDAFLRAVHAAMRANIRHVRMSRGAPIGTFDGFTIRP